MSSDWRQLKSRQEYQIGSSVVCQSDLTGDMCCLKIFNNTVYGEIWSIWKMYSKRHVCILTVSIMSNILAHRTLKNRFKNIPIDSSGAAWFDLA